MQQATPLLHEARQCGAKFEKWKTLAESTGPVALIYFYAYMPLHKYIFAPSRELWPASSVNSRLGPVKGDKLIPASAWLDENRPVEQMTWAPGLPILIRDRLISDGGWIRRPGVSCFNLYRPPRIKLGNPTKAQRWLDHVRKVFGDDAEHIVGWLAHRRQHPKSQDQSRARTRRQPRHRQGYVAGACKVRSRSLELFRSLAPASTGSLQWLADPHFAGKRRT